MNSKRSLEKAIFAKNVEKVASIINSTENFESKVSLHIGLNFKDPWFPMKGYVEINRLLCSSGKFDLDELQDGKTPLTALAEKCHNSTETYAEIFSHFLKAGANPNILDKKGWSPLAYCISKLNVSPRIVESLLNSNADVNLIVESNDFIGIPRRSILGMAYYNSKHFFTKLVDLGAEMTKEEIQELKDRKFPLEPKTV